MPSSATSIASRLSVRATLIATRDADACFAMFVERLRAQEVGGGLRAWHPTGPTSRSTGAGLRSARAFEGAFQAFLDQFARMKAERKFAEVVERAVELSLRLAHECHRSRDRAPVRRRGHRGVQGSEPPVLSRSRSSSRRRSSSPASTSRRREAARSATWARTSAWSRAFAAASRAAAATPSTSPGSSSTAWSWMSAASGRPSRSTSVTARGEPGRGSSSLRAGGVHVAAGEPVADLQCRVAERAGERVSQRSGGGIAELDDQVGDRRPLHGARRSAASSPAATATSPSSYASNAAAFASPRGVRQARDRRGREHEADRRSPRAAASRARRSAPTAPAVAARRDGDERHGEHDRRDLAAPDAGDERRRVGGRDGRPGPCASAAGRSDMRARSGRGGRDAGRSAPARSCPRTR